MTSILHCTTGETIFSYSCDNMHECLRQAILENVDLSNSNLSNSNLRNSNLRNSDLRNSDLSNSDLSNSNLSNSNLRNSDLRNSDLRNSDLRYSDLRNSDLSNSNLRNSKGFILLPVQDARGYSHIHAILCLDGWRIRAGCRDFTINQAESHWGEYYLGNRGQGDLYLYAINWLKGNI